MRLDHPLHDGDVDRVEDGASDGRLPLQDDSRHAAHGPRDDGDQERELRAGKERLRRRLPFLRRAGDGAKAAGPREQEERERADRQGDGAVLNGANDTECDRGP